MQKLIKFTFIILCFTNLTSAIAGKESKDTVIVNQATLLSQFPDLFYEYKIAGLNAQTPLNLEYNEKVKEYIILYLNQRRAHLSEVIGLAELYFPIFEEYLDKYGLPLELKYLPVVESGLNPKAKSATGALGLWQFQLNSAKMFDLQITSYLDERCDPYKSTDAACRYLKYLFNMYNDWNLVMAAYNSGPGEVRDAIQRSGGNTDFWQISKWLPEQAQNYLPAFIAINYLLNYYPEHHIEPKNAQISFFDIDTLQVTHPLSFKHISETIGISMETLRLLNPSYKLDYIPANGHKLILILPGHFLMEFVKNENKIYAHSNSVFEYHENSTKSSSTEKNKKIVHEVKKGEFLHKIALKYHCTIDEIIKWNELQDSVLYEGQKLEIWISSTDY